MAIDYIGKDALNEAVKSLLQNDKNIREYMAVEINKKSNAEELDVERKRIDALTKGSGDTLDALELQDIRIGENSFVYENAGTAVRSQISYMRNALSNNYDIQGWSNICVDVWEEQGLKGSTGDVDDYAPNKKKAIHSGFFSANGSIRVILTSGYQFRLYKYDENKSFVSYSIVVESCEMELEQNCFYRIMLVHGNAGDVSNADDIAVAEGNNVRLFRISNKLLELEKFVATGLENLVNNEDLQYEIKESLPVGGYAPISLRKSWEQRPLKRDGSAVDSYAPSKTKAIHSGFFSVDGLTRIIIEDGYQARLHTFASDVLGTQTEYRNILKTTDIVLDATKFYALDLVRGEIENIPSSEDIDPSGCSAIKVFSITDKLVKIEKALDDVDNDDRYNTRNRIYGIEIDNSTGEVVRIADAKRLTNDYVVGESFVLNSGNNNFDNIFPWCDMRLCNVKIENGIKVITYEGESGFSLNGSNGDVMVEIPKFYSMRTVFGDKEQICISGEKKSGFELEPAFYDSETGKELNYIYCGAYLTSVENGKHTSKTGVMPTTNKTLLEFRDCGEMYDFAMLQALQKLISIEFGAINMSSYMGGLSYLIFPGDAKAFETVSSTNTAVFYSDDRGGSSNIDNLFIGTNITVNRQPGVIENRKVIGLGEVTIYTDSNNKKWHKRSVTFNGSPVDVVKDETLIYCYSQDNGLSDGMVYHTGRKGLTNVTTADQFRYRNIEGLWGNVGEMMDGVRLKDLAYYFSYNKNDYADINKYNKISFPSVEQNQYNFYKSFILKMGYDRRYPTVNLPCKISWDGSGDYTKFYGDILCANHLTGADGQSFPAGTEFIGISGMAWDAGTNNGLYMYRFWHEESSKSWLYSTRMIYRTL